MLVWLLRGRATLKAEVATRVTLDPATLPYNHQLLEWLEQQHAVGRQLWLCTASNEYSATSIARHIGFFEGTIASNRNVNLSGEAKAARLVEQFGERGFDYCGNENRDIAVWRHAHGAIVVRGDKRLERAAATQTTMLHTFPSQTNSLNAMLRAIRLQQWAKNALVLVPILAAHRVNEFSTLMIALLAAVSFSLCASSAYVLNDLLDLKSDRVHPAKSKRPFASGELPLQLGFILTPSLLAASLLVSAFLPVTFLGVMLLYFVSTLAYSFALKKIVIMDVLTLAGLYTLRVIAGAVAVHVRLSFWLLLFSLFLFLSLAFVKRFSELSTLRRRQLLQAVGRGYDVNDLPSVQSFGSSAGYLSVLVLALYINSTEIESLYDRPQILWLLCILLLAWISRVWMQAQRGEMHDDPVVFALKDPVCLIICLVAAGLVGLAV